MSSFAESPEQAARRAVVIRNLHREGGRLLPMPDTRSSTVAGLAAPAALGITEETDAVVVVVSEARDDQLLLNGNA